MAGTYSELEFKNEMENLQLAPRRNPEPPRVKIALELCGLPFAQVAMTAFTPDPEIELVPEVEEQELMIKSEDAVSVITEKQSSEEVTVIHQPIKGNVDSSPHPHEGDSIGAAASGDPIEAKMTSGPPNTTQSPTTESDTSQEYCDATEKVPTRASVASRSTYSFYKYPGVYQCIML